MSALEPPLLEEGLTRLGIPFSSDQLINLQTFLEELERWNRRYGFVGQRGRVAEPELIVRHVLDSLSAWSKISSLEQRKRVADVGSGAGFPGIPLAVFLPDSRFTLVEPAAKKAAFLRNVVILAHLENVEIAEARLEEVQRRFDLVVFRAFAPLSRELAALKRIVEPQGVILAYKGKRLRVLEELTAVGLDPAAVQILEVRVPFLDEERHLVILRQSSSGA